MSKKKSKQPAQTQRETPAERAKRLRGMILPQKEAVDETEPLDEAVPDSATESPSEAVPEAKTVDQAEAPKLDPALMKRLAKLEENEQRLAEREKELSERTKSLENEVKAKVDERIKNMGIDPVAAQEEAKNIITKAKAESVTIRGDAEREAKIKLAELETTKKLLEDREKIQKAKEDKLSKDCEQLSSDKTSFEVEKSSYKKEINDELTKEFEKQIAQINEFSAQKEELENKVEYFREKAEQLKEDLNDAKATEDALDEANRRNRLLSEDYNLLKEKKDAAEEKCRKLQDDVDTIGSDPLIYKRKFESLETEYKKLMDKLADLPGEMEMAQLRSRSEEYEVLLRTSTAQAKELAQVKAELTDAKINSEMVDDYIKYVKILTESKRQLQAELSSLQDQYSSENNAKFKALSAIDNKPLEYHGAPFTGNLHEFCDGFVAFAQSGGKPLYYKPETIYSFISWLACTRTVILEGLSGTGKTSLPVAFSRYAGWFTSTVSVQSAWKDRNDLVGFFNDFKKEYKETDFLKAFYEADKDSGCPALIILDEMNLSRIEYYYADFLSQLEQPNPEKRVIDLLPEQTSSAGMPKLFRNGGSLPIGDNLWFIGTANKDDSTFAITDKVYDRAGVIHFSERVFQPSSSSKGGSVFMPYGKLNQLFEEAKFESGKASSAGKDFEEIKKNLFRLLDDFEISIGNRMVNQLDVFVPVYLACAGSTKKDTVFEAIDAFFPYKVLRKLEGLYDQETKKHIGSFIDFIDQEKYKLPKMKKFLQKLQSNID